MQINLRFPCVYQKKVLPLHPIDGIRLTINELESVFGQAEHIGR